MSFDLALILMYIRLTSKLSPITVHEGKLENKSVKLKKKKKKKTEKRKTCWFGLKTT